MLSWKIGRISLYVCVCKCDSREKLLEEKNESRESSSLILVVEEGKVLGQSHINYFQYDQYTLMST